MSSELPTEPGWYLDKTGDPWWLDKYGWWLRGEGREYDDETAAAYAPFTRLVPLTDDEAASAAAAITRYAHEQVFEEDAQRLYDLADRLVAPSRFAPDQNGPHA